MKYYKTIQSLHADYGVSPHHPLVDIQRMDSSKFEQVQRAEPAAYDFYKISFVQNAADFIATPHSQPIHGALFFTPPAQA